MKFTIASEQLKLQLWSVVFGSLIIDVLILYAGSLYFLIISGLIFGSMSRRGKWDFWLCGLPGLISVSIVVIFFHFSLQSVSDIPFSITFLEGYAALSALMVSSLLLAGLSGAIGSLFVIGYVRRKYGEGHGNG